MIFIDETRPRLQIQSSTLIYSMTVILVKVVHQGHVRSLLRLQMPWPYSQRSLEGLRMYVLENTALVISTCTLVKMHCVGI